MFERFTAGSRRAILLAQEEARLLNHTYIGTEHLLLGLLADPEGTAARALASLDVTLEAAREQVREMIGEGAEAPTGHITFTPRAKKVLEQSLREALTLRSQSIGTEHLLLGLVTEGEGVGAQTLVRLGASLNAVRTRACAMAGRDPDPMPGLGTAGLLGAGRLRVEGLGTMRRRLESIERRVASIERRLATIEEQLGIVIDVSDLSDVGDPEEGEPELEEEPPAGTE